MANPFDQGTDRSAGPAADAPKTRAGASATVFPSAGGQPPGSSASTASGLKETARTATDAIRQQAARLAQDVGHELNKTGEAQKARGAEAIRRFARAIDNAASELQNQSPAVARSVHEAARQVDGLSDNLSNKNVSELVNSATQLARAQPALFIGGSVAAGFALARFLKSSSRQRSGGRFPANRNSTSPYVSGKSSGDAANPRS